MANSFRWFFNDLTIEEESLVLSPDMVQPTDKVYCFAQVEGEFGDIDVASTFVTVSNSEPVFTNTYILPSVGVRSGTELTCYSVVSDPDLTEISHDYSWSRNGELLAIGQSLVLNDDNAKQGDIINCSVLAQDEHGGTATMDADVEVINSLPEINNVGINPVHPTSQDNLQCTATASDHDGDDISLTYSWLVDGVLQSENTALLSGPFNPSQEITCQVTPNDGFDSGELMESTVTVINSPPAIHSITLSVDDLTLDESQFRTNDTITATVEASDVDDDFMTYHFDWYVDGILVRSGLGDSLDGHLYFDKGQLVYVIVTPNDGISDGESVTSQISTIANTKSEIVIAQLGPNPLYTTDTLSVDFINVQDVDGDDVSLIYEWFVNGTLLHTSSINTLSDFYYTSNDEIYVEVSHNDGVEYGDVYTTNPISVSSTPPEMISVSILPEEPNSQDSLTCIAFAFDTDDDDISMRYSWTIDGELQPETSSVFSGILAAGDTVSCTVVPEDQSTNGDSLSNSVMISNSAPVVQSVVFNSEDVYTNDILQVIVQSTDLDDDPILVSYDWYVDGLLVKSGLSTSLDGSEYFDKNQEVLVIVSASDGELDSEIYVSDALRVLNTPPTTPTVSMGTEYPPLGEDLYCSIVEEAFDADGDVLTYDFTWYVNDLEWQGTTLASVHSGDGIEKDLIYIGDQWRCDAQASDGTGLSEPVSSTGTISDCPVQYYYDIVEAYADVENPHSCWSHGSSTDQTSPVLLPLLYTGNASGLPEGTSFIGNGDYCESYNRDYCDQVGIIHYGGSPIEHRIDSGYSNFRIMFYEDTLTVKGGSRTLYLRWQAPRDATCTMNYSLIPVTYATYWPDYSGSTGVRLNLLQNHVVLETMDISGYLNQYFYMDITTEVEAGDIIDLVFFDYDAVHFDWTSFSGGITCDYGDLQTEEENSDGTDDSSEETDDDSNEEGDGSE
jgi:hypothetical protein